ncbi:MAG: tRNA pseudouridine(13) synthase TruD [Candidatus Helarchaeota archaeon]
MKRPKNYQSLGLEYYSTSSTGIGGNIRQTLHDFIVEEISLDNKISYCFKENKNIKYNKSGDYLRFSLVKYGLDTLRAIQILSEHINYPHDRIGFAGMKDKNAITSQFISIRKGNQKKIKDLKRQDIKFYNFHTSNSPIKIGDLYGNHFVITIRNIEGEITEIQNKLSQIISEMERIGGLINYFGLQRFGTIRPISHLVGKEILKKNFEKAVKIYLTEIFPEENSNSIMAREELKEDWDFEKAIKRYPKHLIYENMMIKSLIKHPNDYEKAIGELPKRLQSMLLYSYQSYLYNKILSRRKEQDIPFNNLRIDDDVLILDEQELPTNAHFIATKKNFSHLNELIEKKRAVIAAPLVGFESTIRHDYIKQILVEEQVNLEDFKSENPQFNRKGGFRSISVSPLNFEIKEIAPDELNSSKNKIVIDFSLKRGQYATIILEEIIKNKKLEK